MTKIEISTTVHNRYISFLASDLEMILMTICKLDFPFVSSTRSRNDFDDGLYSEQLMLRNLFVNWLLVLEENENWKKKRGFKRVAASASVIMIVFLQSF